VGDVSSDFTLLLPVYHGDRLDFLREAYRCAVIDQILQPTHVVIVRDGPVSEDVDAFLDTVESEGATVVRLSENGGLSAALNAGLDVVTTEIVARADADDICLPRRFSTQIPMIQQGLDVVGSAIEEFETNPDAPGVVRPRRTDPGGLAKFARFETPLFHPTVTFRKSAVLAVGGYPELPYLEDYLLWSRMIVAGKRLGNSPEVLVRFRSGAGSYARRGGTRLLRSEIELQKQFLHTGFTTRTQFVRNVVLRGAYRLTPQWIRRTVYSWHQRRISKPQA
jgi:glycosyltransferase involved in cell wall biosynthesis